MEKLLKIYYFILIRIVGKFNPAKATQISYKFYKKRGMKFNGVPNYISSKVYFDGGNYSLIEIGNGVTISSEVSFLTHDWALNTVIKSTEFSYPGLLGRHKKIILEDNVFVGRGTIIMPGAVVGEGTIIGAGCVVRGVIPKFSVVIGNPCQVIGDTRDYIKRFIN
ncbi:MAG: acyltransferase [Sphingobacterium mizutaii]|nr:acyltransferase [Sphingobacterium mizutaii]